LIHAAKRFDCDVFASGYEISNYIVEHHGSAPITRGTHRL